MRHLLGFPSNYFNSRLAFKKIFVLGLELRFQHNFEHHQPVAERAVRWVIITLSTHQKFIKRLEEELRRCRLCWIQQLF